MTDVMDAPPLVEMFAYRPSWSIFLPGDSDGEGDNPSIEMKAGWLARTLKSWAAQVEPLVREMTDLEAAGHDLPSMVGDQQRLEILGLLESLLYAADTLLAFKRRDHQVAIPDHFLKVAQVVFARAEERGVHGKDRTLYKIANRVNAARPRATEKSIPTKVDDQGRVFDLSGERLFFWDPEKIQQGERRYEARKAQLLSGTDAVESRNGR